jgi:dephospho-CoA kinase
MFMYCVGLTGNIASGKSSAAAYFKTLGVAVIDADNVAKTLTAKNQPAFSRIINYFGQHLVTTTGELDRTLLRTIIFNDNKKRRWLEHLLHPLIKASIEQWVNQQQALYCVIEIPLLKRQSNYSFLNRILVLVAQPMTQISRLMQRDHCDRQQALAIIAAQPSIYERIKLADDIIINNGLVTQLHKDILHYHNSYLDFAKQMS